MTKYNFGFRRKDDPARWLKIYQSLPHRKEAAREAAKKHRKKKKNDLVHKEKNRKYCREWWAQNKDRQKKYRKDNAQRNTMYQRHYLLKRKYNLTIEEYESMRLSQNGVCWICKAEPGGRWKKLFIDHDHKTGKVRGLLCHLCNMALERVDNFSDQIKAYLEAHK